MKPVSTLPTFSLAATHTSLRLAISLSLPFRSLFLILSKSPKERKREGKWRKGEVARWRKLWAIANDEVDKVLIKGDNRQWRWWITRVGGQKARLSSTINLYPEVSSPSSASLSSLLDVSPYANASAAAVNDRKSCSYNGCDNSNVRDQQVP